MAQEPPRIAGRGAIIVAASVHAQALRSNG
jgi:hypothetical protein